MEEIIDKIVDSEVGWKYNLSSSIADIEEIPFNDFDELREEMARGHVVLRNMPVSIDSTTFKIISTRFEKIVQNLALITNFAVPVAALIGGFFISYYLFILIPVVIVAYASTKRLIWVFVWILLSMGFASILPLNNPIAFWAFPLLTGFASFAGLLLRRVYLHALFDRAMKSEKDFSYLFTAKKINVEIPGIGIIWRDKEM